MFQNLKKKVAEHKEDIVYGAVVTGAVAAYVAVVVWAVKKQNAQIAEAIAQEDVRFNTLTEAFNRGAKILPNRDGSFWIFDEKTIEQVVN